PLFCLFILLYPGFVMGMGALIAVFLSTFALVLGSVVGDPDLLQDICVADLSSGVSFSDLID
ncbi:hypothetical protein CCACVL1_09739, partial [Corchorus capsularis]